MCTGSVTEWKARLQDDVKEVQSRLSKMMAAFKGKVTTRSRSCIKSPVGLLPPGSGFYSLAYSIFTRQRDARIAAVAWGLGMHG